MDIERHGPSAMSMGIVSPVEADSAVAHGNQAGVGDGNTVGIAREISQDLRRAGKGALSIDDPFGLGCRAQQSGKRPR